MKPFSLRTCLQTPENYIHTYRYEYSENAEHTLIVVIYSDITVCSFPIEANGLTGWRMCFCGRILQTIIIVHERLQHSNWMNPTWWAYLTSGGCIFHAGIHWATIGERLLRTYKTTHITTSWTLQLANALLCIYTNSVVVHLCGGAGHQTYYVIIDNDTLYFDLFPMVEWHQQVVSTLSYPGLLWMKSCTWTHDVQESTISILWILCKSKLMV